MGVKAVSSTVSLMKYGVMLFSMAYLILTVVTAIHVMVERESFSVAVLALYFYTHVVANWMALFSHSNRDPGIAYHKPDSEKQAELNYCPDCDIVRQNQSHHCPLCRFCVLKQDHHCFFFGTCVGLNNQRYFILLCFYTSLGSFYLASQILLTTTWLFPAWYNYLELFLPFGIIFSLFRAGSFYDVCMTIACNSSTVIGMVCLAMLGLQVHLLALDLTWYEYKKPNRNSETRTQWIPTAWSNFRHNFGPNHFHRFLIPVMPSLSKIQENRAHHYQRLQV